MQIKDKEEKDKEYEEKTKYYVNRLLVVPFNDYLVIVTLIDTRDRHFDRHYITI